MKKYRGLLLICCIALLMTACGKKNNEEVQDGADTTNTVNSEAVVSDEAVKSTAPRVYLEDYNLRVIQESDLDFMIITENVDTVSFSESDIQFPAGVSGEPMIIGDDEGNYEVLIFGVVGKAGNYELTIPTFCFGKGEEYAPELKIPFAIDNKNISPNVKLTCTPSTTTVAKGGALTGLLEYTGDIASYNLGDISITCHGFTADVKVSMSQTTNEHMLTISNIQLEEGATETYFDICEGTVYDADNKPCNGFIVNINIVDELPEE